MFQFTFGTKKTIISQIQSIKILFHIEKQTSSSLNRKHFCSHNHDQNSSFVKHVASLRCYRMTMMISEQMLIVGLEFVDDCLEKL